MAMSRRITEAITTRLSADVSMRAFHSVTDVSTYDYGRLVQRSSSIVV